MDRPNIIPWPPILYGGALILGLVLGRLWPLPWVTGGFRTFVAFVGLVLACSGLLIDLWVFFIFKHHRTSIKPTSAASVLVTTGPFEVSRNPIYVGNTMFVLGVAMLFGELWLFPFAILAVIATQKLAIEREEAHLERQFGLQWKEYARRVPRWIRFSRF